MIPAHGVYRDRDAPGTGTRRGFCWHGVIRAAVSECCRRGRSVPHGVKLLTPRQAPVPVVQPVCLAIVVGAVAPGPV